MTSIENGNKISDTTTIKDKLKKNDIKRKAIAKSTTSFKNKNKGKRQQVENNNVLKTT